MTHTPTPWKYWLNFIGTDEEDTQTVAYTDCHRNRTGSLEREYENAKFIVKACNNYDKLVEALKHLSNAISDDENDYPDRQLYKSVMEADDKARELLHELGELL